MSEIWFTEIIDASGKSTGLRSNLPDLACVLELIYDVRRANPAQVVRIVPPNSTTKADMRALLTAGAEIVAMAA